MRKLLSLLSLAQWNGIGAIAGVVACVATILIGLRASAPPGITSATGVTRATGFVQVQGLGAWPFYQFLEIPEAMQSAIKLTYNNQPVDAKHLQIRDYLIQNQTGRYLMPSDFDAPIAVKSLGGNKIVGIDVSFEPPLNRPAIVVERPADNLAVIPPMLLNAHETIRVHVLLSNPEPVPRHGDPFAGDDGVLQWTAEIKGAELSIVSFPGPYPSKHSWFETYVLGVRVMHAGNAIVAIVAIALLLSWLQLKSIAIIRPVMELTALRSIEMTARIGLAWAAAEVLVSFDDTSNALLWPFNWLCLIVYLIALIPPFIAVLRRLFPRAAPPPTTH